MAVTAVLGLLIMFCVLLILIGLIRPSAVIRWGKPEKRKRGKVILTYGALLIVLLIVVGATAENEPTQSAAIINEQTNAENEPGSEIQEAIEAQPVAESEPKEPEQETEIAVAEEASAEEAQLDERLTPEWNMEESDALENGNFYLAVELMNALDQQIPAGKSVPAEEVLKTPWNYYGQSLAFTGVVEVVQDFPPGSEDYMAGRQSDVVLTTDDGTTVEFFINAPSGSIKVGQTVTMTGYPIGRTDVDNTLGGSFTHLIIVTNKAN